MRVMPSASAWRSSGGGMRFGVVRQGGKHANPIILGKKSAFGLDRGEECAALFLEGGGRVEEEDEK